MCSKGVILIAIFGFLLESVTAFNCSSIIKIQSFGVLNYLATVSFPAPKNIEGSWGLQMETDVPFTFIGGWSVWVQADAEEGKVAFRSRASDLSVEENDNVSFSFRISWSTNERVPEVISMEWEGVQVCKAIGRSVEAIKASRRRQNIPRTIPPQGRRSRVHQS